MPLDDLLAAVARLDDAIAAVKIKNWSELSAFLKARGWVKVHHGKWRSPYDPEQVGVASGALKTERRRDTDAVIKLAREIRQHNANA